MRRLPGITAGTMTMRILQAVLVLLLLAAPSLGRDRTQGDWSDLFEGEKKVYGSEKEEKYSWLMGPIGERENWEGHSSFMFLTWIKYTDYPKYKECYWIPFYYNLDSKIDNREKFWGFLWPGLYYYHKKDGPEELTVHIPVYFSSIKEHEWDRSILYLFWWGKTDNKNTGDRKSYNALYPFYRYTWQINDRTGQEETKFIIYPLYYYKEKKGATYERDITSPMSSAYRPFTSTIPTGGAMLEPMTRPWGSPFSRSSTATPRLMAAI